MIGMMELAVHLWLFGLPVVIATWALLQLSGRAAGRTRYLIVLAGFTVAIALPVARSIEPASAAAAAEIALGETMPDVVIPLWIGGALLLVARDVVGHLRLARRRDESARDALRRALQWPDEVTLLVGGPAPMTAGLLRPYVVMPAGFPGSLSEEVARCVARHELAHARWRDPLVFAVMRIVAALFWVAPLWPLLSWARREREAAADEAALLGETHPEPYVSALLEISRTAASARAPAITAAGSSDLPHRVERLLRLGRARPPWLAIILLAAAATALAITSPVTFAPGDGEPDDEVIRIRHVIRR